MIVREEKQAASTAPVLSDPVLTGANANRPWKTSKRENSAVVQTTWKRLLRKQEPLRYQVVILKS